MIRDKIGVKAVESISKYLGLPTRIGRSKKEVFRAIKERMYSKLKGWKEKSLLKAGKEVLLKLVFQSISTYTMSLSPYSERLMRRDGGLYV